ncbi:hypothetical protein Tco_1537101, partial [Tanacetum coccineum]
VAAAGCCPQVLWIKSQLVDYDVLYDKVPILCDNTSATAISNNPVLHSRTKHIDIRNISFNNNVALLESKYPEYKDMLQFLSHCCISKALVIQPSTVYNKYLRDFWFFTEVVDNTISLSLSHVEKPLSFNRDIFASVIGLEYSKEYVSLPDHEAVKDAIATLGLSNDKESEASSKYLAHSSPLRLRYFSRTWKVLMTYLVKCLGGNQGSHDQLNVNQQMIAYALC